LEFFFLMGIDHPPQLALKWWWTSGSLSFCILTIWKEIIHHITCIYIYKYFIILYIRMYILYIMYPYAPYMEYVSAFAPNSPKCR
jgi:hypothetical protein